MILTVTQIIDEPTLGCQSVEFNNEPIQCFNKKFDLEIGQVVDAEFDENNQIVNLKQAI